jgi:DtxR family manganese transport transcriptional regulator
VEDADPPALLPEATQARRFGRAREARAAEVMEDYAELIADLVAADGQARPQTIARRLGVSHVTVIKAISRLETQGLATARPYHGVCLTEAGLALAERVRARHRIVVDLLVAVGVPREEAESDAEGIEHHVSPATLDAFARFLGKRTKTAV